MHKLSPMLWLSAAALVASSLGCSMCRTDHMCDYAGVGGKWQRGNPTCGRVGSTLSDAGGYDTGSVAQSGANYGDSWGLVEGHPTSVDGSGAIEQEVVEGEVISEEVFGGDEAFDGGSAMMPESSSIMIEQ